MLLTEFKPYSISWEWHRASEALFVEALRHSTLDPRQYDLGPRVPNWRPPKAKASRLPGLSPGEIKAWRYFVSIGLSLDQLDNTKIREAFFESLTFVRPGRKVLRRFGPIT